MLCFKQKIELPTFSLSVLPSFSDTYDITLSASTGVSCSIAGWSRKQRFFGDIEKTFNARFINWYKANAWCSLHYGTSLATIRDSIDLFAVKS